MADNGMLPINVETLAETENYTVWKAEEPDEVTYHVEIGPVTVHFFNEEWAEFVQLIRDAANVALEPVDDDDDDDDDDDETEDAIAIELDWGSLVFTQEEWTEFRALMSQM
jgi:hypothetical protein